MKFLRRTVFESADATASTNSAPIDANQLLALSVQVIQGLAGNATGSVKVQISNDDADDGVPTNWTDVSGATVNLAGAAGSVLIPKMELSYRWIRIVYTRSGGGGILSIKIMCLSL